MYITFFLKINLFFKIVSHELSGSISAKTMQIPELQRSWRILLEPNGTFRMGHSCENEATFKNVYLHSHLSLDNSLNNKHHSPFTLPFQNLSKKHPNKQTDFLRYGSILRNKKCSVPSQELPVRLNLGFQVWKMLMKLEVFLLAFCGFDILQLTTKLKIWLNWSPAKKTFFSLTSTYSQFKPLSAICNTEQQKIIAFRLTNGFSALGFIFLP